MFAAAAGSKVHHVTIRGVKGIRWVTSTLGIFLRSYVSEASTQ